MHTPSSDTPSSDTPSSDTAHAAGPAASRAPPPMIRPITIGAITYRPVIGDAGADGQAGGWIGAFDAGGALLWTAKIYDNVRRADLEGDVQDVFFQEMILDADGTIRITSEAGRRYRFDPDSRSATPLPSPVPDAGPANEGATRITRLPGS